MQLCERSLGLVKYEQSFPELFFWKKEITPKKQRAFKFKKKKET